MSDWIIRIFSSELQYGDTIEVFLRGKAMSYGQRCFFWIPALLIGCSGGSEEFCENTSARTISQDSVTRQYVITVPDSYDGSTPLPMVLGFHGNGGCADDL